MVIYKLNSAGTQVWKKNFDFGGYDFPTRFTFVSDKLSVIGYGSINASYFDWITFQINTSGTMLWKARYNGTTGNDEQPYFLAAKANGEVYATGKGGPQFTQSNGSSYLRMITLKYSNTGVVKWIDSVNIYSGWGLACTLASDSSLFVLSGTNMTAFHFLDQTTTGTCGVPSGLTVSGYYRYQRCFFMVRYCRCQFVSPSLQNNYCHYLDSCLNQYSFYQFNSPYSRHGLQLCCGSGLQQRAFGLWYGSNIFNYRYRLLHNRWAEHSTGVFKPCMDWRYHQPDISKHQWVFRFYQPEYVAHKRYYCEWLPFRKSALP